eukprot:3769033-Prymnesium_polylepis.1
MRDAGAHPVLNALGAGRPAPSEIAAGVRHAISNDACPQQVNWLIRKGLHRLRVYVYKGAEDEKDQRGSQDDHATRKLHHARPLIQLVVSVVRQEFPFCSPPRNSTDGEA